MVNSCSVLGCSNRSTRETGKSFFRIPKIIKNQGEQAEKLSAERRQRWLDSINRNDWNPEVGHWRVCSDHFVSGKHFLLPYRTFYHFYIPLVLTSTIVEFNWL